MNLWIVLIVILNVAAYLMMADDKQRAKKKAWRIPEKRLFGIAACGGALGLFIGMKAYRHKTQHISFTLGIPLLLLWNVVAYYGLYQLVK